MRTCKITSYQALAQEIDSIGPLIDLKRWERAARRMGALVAQLGNLPTACEADRRIIENALTGLADFSARVPKEVLTVSSLAI